MDGHSQIITSESSNRGSVEKWGRNRPVSKVIIIIIKLNK